MNIGRLGVLQARMSRRTFVGAMAASALLVACGDDDDDESGQPAQPTPTSAQDATTPPPSGETPTPGETPEAEDETPTAAGSTPEPAGETPTTAPSQPEPTATTATSAPTDAELVIGHNLDPTTLNSVDTTSAAFQSIFAQISEQLLIFDAEGANVEPWLAESWEWVDDVTLELRLREGVSFTNGEPFDAESAKFTIDQFTASPRYAFFLPGDVYKEATIVDNMTVQLHLNRPFAPLLGFLARSTTALPPVYYQEVGIEGFGQEPVGTGPFMLSEWVKDDHITLVRNEDYWRGPHPLARVTYRVIPEPTARIAAFETGEVDIAMYLPVDALRLEGNPETPAIMVAGLRKYATHFDTKSGDTPALADPRVRQALNHAVDKQAIADSVFQGTADPLQGQWLVETEFGFNPDISMFEYDPDRARELLAEAGYPDGFDLQLSYTAGNTPLEKELGEIVASYMEQVGVRVQQRFMEYGAFLGVRSEGALGTHQWGLLLPPEPHFNFALFTDGSIYQFHDMGDRYDELVGQGTQSTDQAEREQIYHELGQIMHDDPPMLYLVVPRDIYGVNERVTGFQARVDQVLWLFDVSVSD